MELHDVRRRTMQAVKSKDTRPELLVRHLIHRMGFRFRLHSKILPGKPDLVFPSKRKIIFVHGCFWHGHDCMRGARVPKQNREYWTRKIMQNRTRDQVHLEQLEAKGWTPLIIWECQLRDACGLRAQILRFLRTCH